MSRFDAGRWNRILIWTGAALAWSTAVMVAWLEPAREVDAGAQGPVVGETADVSQIAVMPSPTPLGLVILRFTPVDVPQAEVRTVFVDRAVGGASTTPAAPPQPVSSGS